MRLPSTQLHPDLKRARFEMERYAIPRSAYAAWRTQRLSAHQRGIAFRFSLLQWWLWWQQALSGHGPSAKRGKRHGCYVMARLGDAGAYEPGNVHCVTPAGNHADRPLDRQIAAQRSKRRMPLGTHLKVRGDGHPRSKAVVTPAGRFGSAALAAEHHGLTRQGAALRASEQRLGWRYEPHQ